MTKSRIIIKATVLSILSFVMLIAPVAVIFYINRDKWFVEQRGWNIGYGCIVGLIYIIALIKGAFKDFNKHLSRLISIAIILIIVWFFDSILTDVFWIILSGGIGYVFYAILSTIAKNNIAYWKQYRGEKARIIARKEVEYNGRG